MDADTHVTHAVTLDDGGNDMSVGGDNGDDTRWMTYAELAQVRGIREPGAVRLVQRRKWERHKGNDGSTRVAVPLSELRPSPHVTPAVTPVTPDSGGVEALQRERQRADQAEARADRAEVRAEDARTHVEQQTADMNAALIRAAKLEGEATGLREALAEARRPFWQRWLGRPTDSGPRT